MRDGILARKSLHVGAAADDDCVSSGRRGRRWKRFILLVVCFLFKMCCLL